MMSFWNTICNLFELTPEQGVEHHQLMLDYGIVEPTPAERSAWDADDIDAYIHSAPIAGNPDREVWYEGQTGHYRTFVVDQHGHRHYQEEGTFYAGTVTDHQSSESEPIYFGEVVEETGIVTTVKKGPLSWLGW